MYPLLVAIIALGVIVLAVIIWAVWQMVKFAAVLILIIVIFVALWYFGALEGILPLMVYENNFMQIRI